LDQSQPRPRLRLLRVTGVVVAALRYLVLNVGALLAVAWLPCVLESATRLFLEWLVFSYPPLLPDAFLSDQFTPPTWLTAFAVAPWSAMAWAFVLRRMRGERAPAGTPRVPGRPLPFELTSPILVAAAILALGSVFDGFSRLAMREFIFAVARVYDNELPDLAVLLLGFPLDLVRLAVVATITGWIAVVAGHVLRRGEFDIGGGWQLMHGNRLRLAAVFFLLMVAFQGLDVLAGPVRSWLIHLVTTPTVWTFPEAALRYLLDFPLSVLWILLWAVTVGIVLGALARPSPLGSMAPR
jgi:hypothetical protein